MSFTVNPTAIIKTEYAGAIPGVTLHNVEGSDLATIHLTRKSAPIINRTYRKPSDASAINIKANIMVIGTDPRVVLGKSSPLKFHFVQFIDLLNFRALYVGPTSADGYIEFDFANELPFGELLDSDSDSEAFPFFDQNDPTFIKVGPWGEMWNVSMEMDDQPYDELLLRTMNVVNRKFNYLCKVQRQYAVTTALVVRDLTDPGIKKLIYLGRVDWTSNVAFNIRWSKTAPDHYDANQPEIWNKQFSCGDPLIGPDRDLAARIEGLDRNVQTYHDLAQDAFHRLMKSNSVIPNVEASNSWKSANYAEFFR
jgi:hypothetical protein